MRSSFIGKQRRKTLETISPEWGWKTKRASVFDQRVHTLAAFFLERGIAHGKSFVDNEHFGFEKRGHVQAPIFPSATRACSASNCMR
jgi:hypothetical protein